MSESGKSGGKAPLKVAVAGLGTVGAGVLKLLRGNAAGIAARAGRPITVTAVSARNRGKDRGVPLAGFAWFDDPVAMAREADADVVVELIGGANGPAKATVEAAFAAGRSVVTANKALLAHHGGELAAQAEAKGAALAFEAAVAGGIPIVKGLREGLAANRIGRVVGILNGTCNYILTTMRETGRDFADVLADAQALGYAEADPSFDIDGVDAAHKLALLTSLAFGTAVDFAKVHVEGIRHVSAQDIAYADELGYRIKLLAIARRTEAGIEQRVHPCMVPKTSGIAAVEGVFNAVMVEGDFVGPVVFQGRGAGEGPTASAVVADLIDIAAGRAPAAPFGIPAAAQAALIPAPMGDHFGSYYVRLMVVDKPGVFAAIATALGEENVSMESVLQHGRHPDGPVAVVLTIHETTEGAFMRALDRMARVDGILDTPRAIRIEAV
ncbi:homoserine dehydrogenase [Oleispirillum naphthae]|uniref:homoserine dehydrogenase n=1 Tax=Oleispirillum naphthae TaxID=2838853 RepID=UPI00308268F8